MRSETRQRGGVCLVYVRCSRTVTIAKRSDRYFVKVLVELADEDRSANSIVSIVCGLPAPLNTNREAVRTWDAGEEECGRTGRWARQPGRLQGRRRAS